MNASPYFPELAAQSPDQIVVLGPDWRYLYVNPAVEKSLGRPAEELIGQRLWDEFPELGYSPVAPLLRQCMEERVPVRGEVLGPVSGRWYDLSCTPSESTGGIFMVSRDIHPQKLAEEERERFTRDAQRAAAVANELASIAASTQDAVIGKTLEGIVTSWNTAAERLYGYTAADMIGSSISRIAPEDRPDEIPLILERVRQGEQVKSFETFRQCNDGSLVAVSLTVSPIRDGAGVLVGASVIARDVTERRQVEIRQQEFMRDVLSAVTEGRFRLCFQREELPNDLAGAVYVPLLSSAALSLLRGAVFQAASTTALPMDRAADLVMGVGEAAMNALVHAGEGTATVGADSDIGLVRVRVEDRGSGIELTQLPKAAFEWGHSSAGTLGHGLPIILHTCDRVWLNTSETGTNLVLEQDR